MPDLRDKDQIVEKCAQKWYYTIDENIPCFMLLIVGMSRPCVFMKTTKTLLWQFTVGANPTNYG